MRRTRHRIASASLVLLAALAILTPPPAAAQTDTKTNLLGLVDDFAQLEPYFTQVDPDMPRQFAALAAARAKIQAMAPEELASFEEAVALYPTFWNIPADLLSAIADAEGAAAASGRSGGPRSTLNGVCGPDRGPRPDASNCSDTDLTVTSCDGCPPQAGFGAVRGLQTIYALQVTELVAESVFGVINSDFWASIPNPAKIITGVIYFALKAGRLAAEAQQDVHLECTDTWHLHQVNVNIDEQTSTRASQEQINKAAAGLEETRETSLRRAIEANLFAFGQDVPVATFMTPKPNVCTENRSLNCTSDGDCAALTAGTCTIKRGIALVADITRETLDGQTAANSNIYGAEDLYAAAEVQRTANQYRAAYQLYRQAYRRAVR